MFDRRILTGAAEMMLLSTSSLAFCHWSKSTGNRRLMIVFLLIFGIWASVSVDALGQAMGAGSTSSDSKGWVARDPTTGRLYYQQLVPVTVPEVRWENKQITTTVHRPQWVSEVVNNQQTVMTPQTQTVMQPYWIGRWNPFQQPTMAYRYVPQTTWVPTQVSQPQMITRQKWVPQQETITVAQPVTETRTVQQLVQTEISQTAAGMASINSPRMAYSLAHQPTTVSRPPAFGPASVPSVGVPSVGVPSVGTGMVAGTGLRTAAIPSAAMSPPLAPASQSGYTAPLQSTSANGGSRDSLQTGMRPTVLR
jgi:hypothetical protein